MLWEERCEAGNAAAVHNSELILVCPPCFSDVCLVVQCSKAIPASIPVAWFPDCCMPSEIIFFFLTIWGSCCCSLEDCIEW